MRGKATTAGVDSGTPSRSSLPSVVEVPLPAPTTEATSLQLATTILVFLVWVGMVANDLVLVRDCGRNIPFWEDWELVPHLTDHQIDVAWLFSQNAEHRVPLPRLLLLLLLKTSHADFRAGQYFNVMALASLALAMMLTARHLRGRASYVDAIFPLLLLNWGHWHNFLWSWQVQFTSATVLGGVVFLLILCRGNRLSAGTVLSLGSCLILLPLCGANGVVVAPLIAIWLGWAGLRLLNRSQRGAQATGALAIALAVAALASAAAYWIGYHPPREALKRLGIAPAVSTFVAFIGNGFGAPNRSAVIAQEALLPVALFIGMRLWMRRPLRRNDYLALGLCWVLARGLQFQCEYLEMHLPGPSRRTVWGIVGLAAMAFVIGMLIQRWRACPEERVRIAGLVSCFGALAALGAALAWGRAGTISDFMDTPRYYTLAVTLPCTLALTLERYGGNKVLALARPLAVVLAILTAWGHTAGVRPMAEARAHAADELRHDLRLGLPASTVIYRQRDNRTVFYVWLTQTGFYEPYLLILRDAGNPEFQHVQDN